MSASRSNWINVGAGIICDKSSQNTDKKYYFDPKEKKWKEGSNGMGENISLCYVSESSLKDYLQHKPVVTRETYDTSLGVGVPVAAIGGVGIGIAAPLCFKALKGIFFK